MIDTYQLTPEYRVSVDYDDTPRDSAECWYDTVFYEVESCNNLDIHNGRADIVAALEGVEEAVNGYAYTGPRAVSRALIKHLERHGYKAVYRTLPGQCPSDWISAVIAVSNTAGVELDGAVNDWERWYNGDYYVLTLERRHVWHGAAGDTLETWDTVDSLYGVSLENSNDANEVKQAARWYFNVEETA